MKMKCFAFIAFASLSSLSFSTNLTLTAVADDTFTAFVSTNATVQGTQFLTQGSATWQSGTVSNTITLTPGLTNYINISARDVFGSPSMLVAALSLSDAGFAFNDNTQSIVSANDSNWTASLAGFGGATTSITDLGPNGTGPWSNFGTLPANARLIWTPGAVQDTRFFQVAVNPVPEPATLLIVAGGAAIVSRFRKKPTI